MTAVARVRIAGVPSLVGDVVLTSGGKRLPEGGGKVYVIAPNVALGWSGDAKLAMPALRYLIFALGGEAASLENLEAVFDRLDDLRGQPGLSLDLTGWVMTPDGEKGIRWSTSFRPPLFDDDEQAIGSGGTTLRGWLAPAPISRRNTVGYDVAPMKVINGFMIPRCEEMIRPDWDQSWGKAYDAIVWQEGAFRWLEKLTYVRWEVRLDGGDRITSVTQSPMVVTQERVRGCTLIFTKRVGDLRRPSPELSYPVYRGRMDLDPYFLHPYSAVSPYYANYFVVVCPSDNSMMTVALASKNATPNGHVHHAGADPMDPTFAVNLPKLEEELRWTLEEARRKSFVNPPPPVE